MFVPTSAWLVGPATILPEGEASFAMPCVMVNHYNNGYVLRLSGGGGKIFAMAADFRQDAFVAGREYEVTLSVSPDFSQSVSATAHNKGTVLINLQKSDGFYEALRQGRALTLAIGGSSFEFALLGAEDGLARVEECYKPQGNSRTVTEPGQGAAREAMPDEAIPPAYSAMNGGDAMPEPAPMPQPQAPVLAEAPPPAVAEKPQASGDDADDLKRRMAQLDTMIAAAAQKLAALEPAAGAAAPAPVAAAPVPVTGQVAGQPIGRPMASNWLAPAVRQPPAPTQKDVMTAQALPVATHAATSAPAPAAQPAAASAQRQWRAIRGTNLHEVLDVWARHESVRLIWQADEKLAIEESLSMKGSFEEAVQAVLEQHGDDSRRPVGRIFIDPGLNQRVLLVEMKKGS